MSASRAARSPPGALTLMSSWSCSARTVSRTSDSVSPGWPSADHRLERVREPAQVPLLALGELRGGRGAAGAAGAVLLMSLIVRARNLCRTGATNAMSRRSKSSDRWLKEHFADPFVQRAQSEGWRSRAVFKLEEIDRREQLLKAGRGVPRPGGGPGGLEPVRARPGRQSRAGRRHRHPADAGAGRGRVRAGRLSRGGGLANGCARCCPSGGRRGALGHGAQPERRRRDRPAALDVPGGAGAANGRRTS